jgi:hypothetical protein
MPRACRREGSGHSWPSRGGGGWRRGLRGTRWAGGRRYTTDRHRRCGPELLVKAIDPARASHTFRLNQFGEEQVALGIHVGRNSMRDFLGIATEFYSHIAGRGAYPNRPSVIRFLGTPEANVIALLRAVADRLFKGAIFLALRKLLTVLQHRPAK